MRWEDKEKRTLKELVAMYEEEMRKATGRSFSERRPKVIDEDEAREFGRWRAQQRRFETPVHPVVAEMRRWAFIAAVVLVVLFVLVCVFL